MFEVDEEDVNKLLETEETEGVAVVEQASEERTDLEDVFRSEMMMMMMMMMMLSKLLRRGLTLRMSSGQK